MKFSNSLFDQSNRFKVLLFDKRTKNVEKKNRPYPTTREEKTENGGDQKRISPSHCMRGDAVLANCALASQRLHLQLCSCLQIARVRAACTPRGPTYYLHVETKPDSRARVYVCVCVCTDFIQRCSDTEWRRAK